MAAVVALGRETRCARAVFMLELDARPKYALTATPTARQDMDFEGSQGKRGPDRATHARRGIAVPSDCFRP